MTKPLTGKEPAFPSDIYQPKNADEAQGHKGMPIRLHLAAEAMKGILANEQYRRDTCANDGTVGQEALKQADALIAAYNKEQE